MTTHTPARVRVAVIGGGPSGLAAATALAGRVDGQVLVIEREPATGGIPRHCGHTGFGVRDLRRVLTGPEYARRRTDLARDAGARLLTGAMVTGWEPGPGLGLLVTSPAGRQVITADVVVLATGARERPRAARWIPGDRPAGVLTTGYLQNLVHGDPTFVTSGSASIGTRAVVVGADPVSWSAALTLRVAGCRTVALLSTRPPAESSRPFRTAGAVAMRAPVIGPVTVVSINGRSRVESVLVEHAVSGRRRLIACDTVVLTADWIPDHELARLAGLDLDPASGGPRVDTALATSSPGVFAIGNLVHPVDTADAAALDGAHVAAQVLAHLTGSHNQSASQCAIVADPPLRWITPQLLRAGGPAPPRYRLLAWSEEFRRWPTVYARQPGGRVRLRRLPWPVVPGRVVRVPFDLIADVDPTAGPVHIGLAARG